MAERVSSPALVNRSRASTTAALGRRSSAAMASSLRALSGPRPNKRATSSCSNVSMVSANRSRTSCGTGSIVTNYGPSCRSRLDTVQPVYPALPFRIPSQICVSPLSNGWLRAVFSGLLSLVMEAIHDLDQFFRHWLSAIRLFGTAAVDEQDRSRTRSAPSGRRRPSVSAMSEAWLVEHHIAAGKHFEGPGS